MTETATLATVRVGSMKILLVDDDPDILDVLEATFELFGSHSLHKSRSGRDALTLIESEEKPFDLFLLDIQMPGITGIEVCTEIRTLPQYRFTPIIMVTAMSDRDHVSMAFAAGATDYITKPLQFDDLKLRVSLAEKAAFQAQKLADFANQGESNQVEKRQQRRIQLGDAVPIDDVDGVLRVHAFENYLAQLSRLQFMATRLKIVNVSNIQSIHDRTTSREFVDQVTDIAECISDALHEFTPLIAYFGRGIFGVAVHRTMSKSVAELTSDIYHQMEDTGLVYQDGTPVLVELEIAEITKMPCLTTKRQTDFIDQMVRKLKMAAHSQAAFPGGL